MQPKTYAGFISFTEDYSGGKAKIEVSTTQEGIETIKAAESGDVEGLVHLYWHLLEKKLPDGVAPDAPVPEGTHEGTLMSFYRRRLKFWQNEFYNRI